MLHSFRGLVSPDSATNRLYSSLLKPCRSSNTSPIATRRSISTARCKSTARKSLENFNPSLLEEPKKSKTSSVAEKLTSLKDMQQTLKIDHMGFQSEVLSFLAQMKEMFSESAQSLSSIKETAQSSEKSHQFVYEQDSAKLGTKKKFEEKDKRVKELQLIIKKKDQEVVAVQKSLERKEEDLKAKDKYILKIEKTCAEIKNKFQQEIKKLENDKVALESQHLRELALTKSEKEEVKPRLTHQTPKKRETANNRQFASNEKSGNHEYYGSLTQETRNLKDEQRGLLSQLQASQEKMGSLEKDNDTFRKSVKQSQELIRELEEKVLFLSQELDIMTEGKNTTQVSLDEMTKKLEETALQLDHKAEQNKKDKVQLEEKHKLLEERTQQLRQSNNRVNELLEYHKQPQDSEIGKKDMLLNMSKETYSISRSSVTSSREVSPKSARKTQTKRENPLCQSLNLGREKELQEKVTELEKVQKELKSKNQSLSNESTGLTKKFSLKEKENQKLKDELHLIKEKLKSSESVTDNFGFAKSEAKELQKVIQTHENDLKKAKTEVQKLTLAKEKLELTLQGKAEKASFIKRDNISDGFASRKVSDFERFICSNCQDTMPKKSCILDETASETGHKEARLLNEEELDRLRKENSELSSQLNEKDIEMDSLLKLSAENMKLITNDFLDIASNALFDLEEKFQVKTKKWENLENIVQKLMLKYRSLLNENQVLKSSVKVLEELLEKREGKPSKSYTKYQTPTKHDEKKHMKKENTNTSTPRPSNKESESKQKPTLARSRSEKEGLDILSKSVDLDNSIKETPKYSPIKVDSGNSKKKPVKQETGQNASGKKVWVEKENEKKLGNPQLSDKKGHKRTISQPDFSKAKEPDSSISFSDPTEEELKSLVEKLRALKSCITIEEDTLDSSPEDQSPILEQVGKEMSIQSKETITIIRPLDKYNPRSLEDIKEVDHETDTLQDE